MYVVHSVDTEGPLCESLEATFKRLQEIFGIRLPATPENLRKLQIGQIQLGGRERLVASAFRPELLTYHRDWTELDEMLQEILAVPFRDRFPDSRGRGWLFNWHCVDHVGYSSNPRRRAQGYHTIFDHYVEMLRRTDSMARDEINWHFHPMSVYREAHRCATSYINSPHLYEILCRRLIERDWFPRVHRAGFHAERPDSHWFLEQWVPFDLSNQAVETDDTEGHADAGGGRFGDWRRAPADWSVYHPSHDDYQTPGECRRVIGRCLNLNTRFRNLTPTECERAFERAAGGQPTMLGLCSHDFRDLRPEVETVYGCLKACMEAYPSVEVIHSRATEAFRAVLGVDLNAHEPLELDVTLEEPATERKTIVVETVRGKVFGPQPFLAIQMKGGRFLHDNFDWTLDPGVWTYTFDQETVRVDDIEHVAVAANDALGFQSICKLAP